MRPVLLACLAVAALAGCMEPSDDDWDAYDSGRGLAFGMALTVLLIIGAVVLVVNLTSSRRADEAAASPPPPAPPAPPPSTSPSTGWQTVETISPPARKPSPAKRSSKTGKPRRRSP